MDDTVSRKEFEALKRQVTLAYFEGVNHGQQNPKALGYIEQELWGKSKAKAELCKSDS